MIPNILIVPAYKTNHHTSWIDRVPGNMRKVHEADVVLLHEIGTGFTCNVVKDRKRCLNTTFGLNQIITYMLNYYRDLPRKKKKAYKKAIMKQAKDYMDSY